MQLHPLELAQISESGVQIIIPRLSLYPRKSDYHMSQYTEKCNIQTFMNCASFAFSKFLKSFLSHAWTMNIGLQGRSCHSL